MLAAVLMLVVLPAVADEWRRYENQTYGYAIDVPPGLAWRGEGGNGDGQDFTSPMVTLSLIGEPTPDGFEAAIREWQEWEGGQGWNPVYSMLTPSKASVSARRAGWLMEMRAIRICHDAMVTAQLEYGVADAVTMQPVIERLARSLVATRRC